MYDCTAAQLTSLLRGCLHTLPRLEGTIQSAGLEVIDTWVCDPRRPITETIVTTLTSSVLLAPFFPNDRREALLIQFAGSMGPLVRTSRLHFAVQVWGNDICGRLSVSEVLHVSIREGFEDSQHRPLFHSSDWHDSPYQSTPGLSKANLSADYR